MNFPQLLIPGPTPVKEETLAAMMQPQVGHRTPEFSRLFGRVTSGLQEVLGTRGPVLLFSNPASGLWEATVRNTVERRCLNLVNGAFSARWHEVTKACGIACDALERPWGQAILPEDVEQALARAPHGGYDVITLVHNETSTGVMNPLEEIAALLRQKYPHVLLHVDAVSSMAAVDIQVDTLGLDTCFASVQKAWGLPAGFTVCAISDRALERSSRVSNKGYYFDFAVYYKFYARGQTPFTSSLPHLYGLEAVLAEIEAETLAARYQRHSAMAQHTREWALGHGQQLYVQSGYESVTLTAVENVLNWDLDHLYATMEARGYRIDRGYGHLRGKTFRVAHMGAVTPQILKRSLAEFDRAIAAA